MNTPTAAQKAWQDLGYGMFLHFGPNTLTGKSWGDGLFPAQNFVIPHLDVDQWASVAREAGMKYAVLTTKHHDGFCLWPSRHTPYSVAQAPGAVDIVRKFVEAFRKAGLQVGFYYSLWDKNFPLYEDDVAYHRYLKDQLTELLTQYGPVVEFWFDGAWDKDYPQRSWEAHRVAQPATLERLGKRWFWSEIYHHIHQLQPNCLVINNSSSDFPGVVKYHPVDVRTSEHFDFISHEAICSPQLDPLSKSQAGEQVYTPLEFCTSLNPDWFWTNRSHYLHPAAETIAAWYRTARSHQANLLLNVGPNAQGVIPEYHREYLVRAARRME